MTDLAVAVNLLWLAPGRVGGSEQYLTRQLAALPADAGLTLKLMCQAPFATAHPELTRRFDVVTAPFARDARGARIVAEHSWLAVRTRGVDVVHHGGGTVPMVGRRPILLTIHDLQFLRFPEFFSRPRLTYLRAMMPRSARRATMIATPSEFVRASVIDAFHVPDHTVVVVPHCLPMIPEVGVAAVRAAGDRLGLGGRPYVVYPAITHPHKRHDVLIEMLSHTDPELMLVLVGGEGTAEPGLQRAISAAGVGARVVRPGRVDDATRDALIAGAQALVFPSEYEGFGAPLIEAMMLGTPIVCSDADAVREVVGDAGVVVAERTGEAWAAGIGEAARRADELVIAGLERHQHYTPEVSGAALAGAYRIAAGRP